MDYWRQNLGELSKTFWRNVENVQLPGANLSESNLSERTWWLVVGEGTQGLRWWDPWFSAEEEKKRGTEKKKKKEGPGGSLGLIKQVKASCTCQSGKQSGGAG